MVKRFEQVKMNFYSFQKFKFKRNTKFLSKTIFKFQFNFMIIADMLSHPTPSLYIIIYKNIGETIIIRSYYTF